MNERPKSELTIFAGRSKEGTQCFLRVVFFEHVVNKSPALNRVDPLVVLCQRIVQPVVLEEPSSISSAQIMRSNPLFQCYCFGNICSYCFSRCCRLRTKTKVLMNGKGQGHRLLTGFDYIFGSPSPQNHTSQPSDM